jgi:enoyl-CoA hydratase
MIRAKRHLLTGDPLLAEDGYQMGMVSDLVDTREEVLPTARRIAEQIAGLPPMAVRGTKMSFNHVMRLRSAEVLELSLTYEAETIKSDDLLEAIDAIEQKRAPKFTGR